MGSMSLTWSICMTSPQDSLWLVSHGWLNLIEVLLLVMLIPPWPAQGRCANLEGFPMTEPNIDISCLLREICSLNKKKMVPQSVRLQEEDSHSLKLIFKASLWVKSPLTPQTSFCSIWILPLLYSISYLYISRERIVVAPIVLLHKKTLWDYPRYLFLSGYFWMHNMNSFVTQVPLSSAP